MYGTLICEIGFVGGPQRAKKAPALQVRRPAAVYDPILGPGSSTANMVSSYKSTIENAGTPCLHGHMIV
jgi:hypothetical protein